MTIQKAGIGAAIPLLLNPAALGVVAIGAVGWGLFNLLRDEEDGCEEPSDIAQKPLAKPEVVKAETKGTAPEGSQTTTQEAACDISDEEEPQSISDECAEETERKLMIRQAMSELGKRSAAARAKRKAAASEGALAAM